MTFFQVATFAFAAIGVASVLYVLVNWFTAKTLEEDGPIRVKGGSITIENDDHDWVKDEGEDKNSGTTRGGLTDGTFASSRTGTSASTGSTRGESNSKSFGDQGKTAR